MWECSSKLGRWSALIAMLGGAGALVELVLFGVRMAMTTCKLALALGLSTWLLLPGMAAATAHSEEQSEAQPQDITPEEFLQGMLGLIERYGQHAENGSGDGESEPQWRHAPPLYDDEPDSWRHAPPLEDEDTPSEDDDSWHSDDPWRHAPPHEDEDTPSEDDDSWHSEDPWRPAPPLEDDEPDMDRPVLI